LGDLVDEFGVGGGVVHGCEPVDELGKVVRGQRCLASFDLTSQHVFDYAVMTSQSKLLRFQEPSAWTRSCLMQEHQAWPPAVRPRPPWNPAA